MLDRYFVQNKSGPNQKAGARVFSWLSRERLLITPGVGVLEHPQPRADFEVSPAGRHPWPLPQLIGQTLRVGHHGQVPAIG